MDRGGLRAPTQIGVSAVAAAIKYMHEAGGSQGTLSEINEAGLANHIAQYLPLQACGEAAMLECRDMPTTTPAYWLRTPAVAAWAIIAG